MHGTATRQRLLRPPVPLPHSASRHPRTDLAEELQMTDGPRFEQYKGGLRQQVEGYLCGELARVYGCVVEKLATGEIAVRCMRHTRNTRLVEINLEGGDFDEGSIVGFSKVIASSKTLIALNLSGVQASATTLSLLPPSSSLPSHPPSMDEQCAW